MDPASVDAVITTCCTFNPTPSLSAVVVNRFRLQPGVKTYSLGGMGCSAGMIAVDLANELLKVPSPVSQHSGAVPCALMNLLGSCMGGMR